MIGRRKKICVSLSAVFLLFVIFLSLYAYSHYLSLKKMLVARLSEQATSYVGQNVAIGDITLNGISGINFHDLSIDNPEGFEPGQLLTVKKLTLNLATGELLKGNVHVRDISIDSPRLSLRTNMEGTLNSARMLHLLLSGKSTSAYQIDRIRLETGVLTFNDDDDYSLKDVNIALSNISSGSGTETMFSAELQDSARNTILVKGTVFLKDDPKKFTVSVSSDDFRPLAFRELIERYGINADSMMVHAEMGIEGDTAAGIRVTSSIQSTSPGLRFLKKRTEGIRLEADAFLDLAAAVFTVKNISVLSGDTTVLSGKAVVADIFSEPSYRAEIRVNKIDLAAFNILPRRKFSGVVTSDTIKVSGKMGKGLPAVSGTIELSKAALESEETEIRNINARIRFSSRTEISASVSASGRIFRAGNYLFDKPCDATMSLNSEGTAEKMTVESSVDSEPFVVRINDKDTVAFGVIHLDLAGDIREKSFSGIYAVTSQEIRHGSTYVDELKSSARVSYEKTAIVLTDFAADSGIVLLSASAVSIGFPRVDSGYLIDIKNFSAEYSKEKAGIRQLDMQASLAYQGSQHKSLSGNIRFSSGQMRYLELIMFNLDGSVQFDRDKFQLNVPGLLISEGKIKVFVEGKPFQSPFPIRTKISADNVDLDVLSPLIARFSRSRYGVSGRVIHAGFDGTINAKDAVYGEASLLAQKVSAFEKTENRPLLKDAALTVRISFSGNEIEFNSDAAVGTVQSTLSGSVSRFMEVDRVLTVSGSVPEITAEEIRNSFWDIFPDSLLYARVGGTVASDFRIEYGLNNLKAAGTLTVKEFMIEGEYGKYSVGPVNGTIPLAYGRINDKSRSIALPVFERSAFEKLRRDYEGGKFPDGYLRLTIGSFRYGFRLINDMEIWIKREDNILNIARLSGNIFGGRLYGSAFIDLADGFNFRTGLLLSGLSLSNLCDDIEPIRGYISGKVDGVASFKGSGGGIRRLIGKADFWSYGDNEEKTKISREFLQKVGGPSVRAYLGERKFDKGIMNLYVQDGFLIFRELEISNRNFFGLQDLSIKVTPFNNRIAIDHLMWTIVQASQRARAKK